MRTSLTSSIFGLGALLAVACGDDADTTATEGGTANTTGISTDPPATDPEPTTGIVGTGTGTQTDTGTLTGTGTQTGTDETTVDVQTETTVDPDTSTSTGPDETSTSTGPDDTSSSSTEPDDTSSSSTEPETSSTTDETDTGVDPDCQAPATQPPCDQGTSDIFKAIGLNCSNDLSSAIPITNPVIMSPDSTAYRVATYYGSAQDPMDPAKKMWSPREGERMLVMTSGLFPALQADGGLLDDFDSEPNGNPDFLPDLPGVMTIQEGSNNGNGGTPFMNCDGVGDCSDTIYPQWTIQSLDNTANDVFYMSFDVTVPLGTMGYIFDFAYFSEEWPNYVDASVNDMFIVWSTSESFTGNVTFIDNQPLTVTALDPYMTIQPGNPLLVDTGFDNGDGEGAATGWFTAKGSAVPGETFTVAVSVMDLGDTIFDTVGILDGFRWDCKGCIPTEVMSCGVQPQ
jgi:hypothetical protein